MNRIVNPRNLDREESDKRRHSWQEALDRAERKHQELQRKVLAIPGTGRVLQRLTKAGANQKKIVSLLASAVRDRGFWIARVRRKKKELESLARQLETLANHAQRVSLDPFSYGTLWLAMLGLQDWKNVKPAEELSPRYIFYFMRLHAKNCRERAKAFGNLLRGYPARQRREMIDNLILEVWLRTRKYHDKEIAFLLTNAFEATGRKRELNEDQIKRHRQRYVVPRIKDYLRSHPVTSPPDHGKGTLCTP